jgi:TPR repeat protein
MVSVSSEDGYKAPEVESVGQRDTRSPGYVADASSGGGAYPKTADPLVPATEETTPVRVKHEYTGLALEAHEGVLSAMLAYAAQLKEEQKYAKAAFYWKQAAKRGCKDADVEYGILLRDGLGIAKDLRKACHHFCRAARANNITGMLRYAEMRDKGLGVAVSRKAATAWFRKASDAGSEEGKINYARALIRGRGCQANLKAGAKDLKDLADAGNARAQACYGALLEYGGLGKPDAKEAAKLYKKSADQHCPEGLNRLGCILALGKAPVRKKPDRAFKLFKEAAELGNMDAVCNLGRCYDGGLGVEKDVDKARELFIRAASTGDLHALVCLGFQFRDGRGVDQNLQKAVSLFKVAAENGDSEAQVVYASMIEGGNGCSRNESLAFEWYKKAADKEYHRGLYNLGRCYLRGVGVESDRKKAKELITLAREKGSDRAKVLMREVKRKEKDPKE